MKAEFASAAIVNIVNWRVVAHERKRCTRGVSRAVMNGGEGMPKEWATGNKTKNFSSLELID